MSRRLVSLILCCGFAALTVACATKSFVAEQVSATEAKLTERVSTQETKLRETSELAGESHQALEATDQRLRGLDSRVSGVGSLASDAKTRADSARVAAHDADARLSDAEARLSQRIADRNHYRLLETRYVYFDSDKAELRREGIKELEQVAKALTADPNAILELQGFADPRGGARYNSELSRERVEAVVRYLVERERIELRQLRATAMGEVAFAAGEKPSREALAKARRVDVRLLVPWSSWEDRQASTNPPAPTETPTVATTPAPAESAQPPPPDEGAAALPRTLLSRDGATPEQPLAPPSREGGLHDDAGVRWLSDDTGVSWLLKVLGPISRKDLGGED